MAETFINSLKIILSLPKYWVMITDGKKKRNKFSAASRKNI